MSNIKEIISNKIALMWQYQDIHNIKGMCIANSYYLKQFINSMNITCKMTPVISIYTDDITSRNIITVHMIVKLDNGDLYDPSWEIEKHKAYPCETVAEYNSWHKQSPVIHTTDGLSHKELIHNFIEFMATAEGINNNNRHLSPKFLSYVKAQHKYTS